MIKSKFAKTLTLSVCLTVGLSGVVYASASEVKFVVAQDQPTELKPAETIPPDTSVSRPSQTTPEEDNVIFQKQREIDRYVFEQYKEEISQKGFMVTHTGPMDNYVEIGIEPYNEANADYLYDILGKDMVKVVQGQQAATLGLESAGNAVDMPLNVATDTKKETEAGKTSLPFVYTIGAVAVLGAIVVALKRLLLTGGK